MASVDAKNRLVVALDIGGTNLKGAVFSEEGEIVTTVCDMPSLQNEEAKVVIDRICTVANIAKLTASLQHQGHRLVGCGIGMPGPFDYENGISHMEHKFPFLNEIDIKTPLQEKLELPVYFLNDAAAFGLGVSWKEYPKEPRLLCLTLGTGLGSAFLVADQLATEADGAPHNGEIWNLPFLDGILEDRISTRGIRKRYELIAQESTEVDVEEIARRARSDDVAAQQTFTLFARDLARGLSLHVRKFDPTRVVFGGGIARAFDLFGPEAETTYARSVNFIPFSQAKNEHLALLGAARFAFDKLAA